MPVWPQVREALLTALPTLPGWDDVMIYDGPPVGDDIPLRYATVGFVSQDDEEGTFQFGQALSGMELEETGEVRSRLTVVTGDAGQLATVRQAAFDLIDALEAYVRADRRLGGVLPPQSSLTLACVPLAIANSDGSGQHVVFALHYYAVH